LAEHYQPSTVLVSICSPPSPLLLFFCHDTAPTEIYTLSLHDALPIYAKPKQFLDVLGTGKTLIQSTYERFLPICPPENVYVVTHEEHGELVRAQLPDLDEDHILLEPMRKNTAPCILYACSKIAQRNKDAVVVVSPADHLILKDEEFRDVIVKAADHAREQDKLLTLGITPTRPETGYG